MPQEGLVGPACNGGLRDPFKGWGSRPPILKGSPGPQPGRPGVFRIVGSAPGTWGHWDSPEGPLFWGRGRCDGRLRAKIVGFGGSVRPRGAGTPFWKVGGEAPDLLEGFTGPPVLPKHPTSMTFGPNLPPTPPCQCHLVRESLLRTLVSFRARDGQNPSGSGRSEVWWV